MNNAFDFFEQIYCINLEHRTDRWENCLNQFHSLGITDRVIKRKGVICNYHGLSKKQNAQIGCTLSHYNILKEAQKNNYSNVLVLEDDFLFLKDKELLSEEINKAIVELPQNWDLFYFGGFFVKGYDHAPAEKFSKNLVKVKTCFSTHAIAYSKNCINKILNSLKLNTQYEASSFIKEHYSIDWYLVKEFQEPNHCFAPKNLLCVQKESYSDIESQYSDYKEKFKLSYKEYVQK